MPLLKKKPFEKISLSDFPSDDELVYYCEITGEIFRDYEQFCDRIILCNSMVWSCSMTGKTGLTYKEAQESEENAKKYLKEFPSYLTVPVLYLATKTKRKAFGDMAEDIFSFVKDRYFKGEDVEASYSGSKWKESHVQQIIAPSIEETKLHAHNRHNNTFKNLPSSLYRYEVEQRNMENTDVSEIITVNFDHIRRKKGIYTKEKNKIFLKYHMEQANDGFWVVKDNVKIEYDLNRIRFDQIFAGPQPNFEVFKKNSKKQIEGTKKTKQETLAKFLTKNNIVQTTKNNNAQNGGQKNKENKSNNILEAMRQKELLFKKNKEEMKKKKAEEKLAEKLKKREENIIISQKLKEWYKPKEDLELEDHKKLPVPTPIDSKIPEKYIGDVLNILEFSFIFSKQLYTKNFFPCGLTFELMERALIEKEVAGPLIDLIQMFLTAIFNLQDEEASQHKIYTENTSEVKDKDWQENLNLTKATTLATVASNWSIKHQGIVLNRLPLYSLTTSEVLRLHLLASGARINEASAKWRFQQRGGYTSEDDPGLYLRVHYPHVLKALASNCVTQLGIGDKLKIINCLIDQILTYADIRDIIDERLEKGRQAKVDLKAALAAERKREQEYLAERAKLKQEERAHKSDMTTELEKLDREAERRKGENLKKIKKLEKTSLDQQILLGYDRAYRRYLKFESVPGIFVEFDDENAGRCLNNVVNQNPALIDADRKQTILHLQELSETSSEKSQFNGFHNEDVQACTDFLLCSADPSTCIVHSTVVNRQRWGFYHSEEQLNTLLVSLNNRGIRESELFQVLHTRKDFLADLIAQTPVNHFNKSILEDTAETKAQGKLRSQKKTRYEDANLGYPTTMDTVDVLEAALVDNIIEMEEKLHAGNLGTLRVKSREEWRSHLQNREFDKMDKNIVRKNGFKKDKEGSNRSETPEPHKEYCDPGMFLGQTLDIESDNSDEGGYEVMLCPNEKLRTSVQSLAIALAQVAYSVDLKYLKRPLGHADIKNLDSRKKDFDLLEQWEQSLLASTSYSQIFLHYGTLDGCIMWARSTLLARCRVCRRQRDSENMLLCDNCNLGHHLYCLKPKLTSIPQGDWFCYKCTREKEKERQEEELKQQPKKRRVLFRVTSDGEEDDEDEMEEEKSSEEEDEADDEEDEEEENNEDQSAEEDEDDEVHEEENDEEQEEEEEEEQKVIKVKGKTLIKKGKMVAANDKIEIDSESAESEKTEDSEKDNDVTTNGYSIFDVCKMCNSGGELLCCDNCPDMYHLECVEPPLRRVPRGQWFCNKCKKKTKKENDVEYANGRAVQPMATSLRRCAEKARHMIHGFAKTLRRISDTDSESDNDSVDTDEDIPLSRRANRRETDSREDLPLHNVALQELLSDVLKKEECWPFTTPVKKNEVPDYYEIITKPMDFGKIKYKLNMGEYKCDADLMADAVLVFENCNVYNDSDSEVAKCGSKLLRFFIKKAKDLGLKLPDEMQEEEENEDDENRPPISKKRRIK